MQIRVFQDTLVGGVWTGIGVGDFSDDIARHLIEIGVAEKYETKVVKPEITKVEKKTISASQPAPASQEPMQKKRRGRPRKSSS